MTHVRTLRIAGTIATVGLLLAAIVAPSATLANQAAADPAATTCHAAWNRGQACDAPPLADETPADEAPADDETPAVEAPIEPGQGEVVFDGPFITPTPEATTAGDALRATVVPGVTPPPTDTTSRTATTAGAGLPLLLLVLAGLSSVGLIAARAPGARRS